MAASLELIVTNTEVVAANEGASEMGVSVGVGVVFAEFCVAFGFFGTLSEGQGEVSRERAGCDLDGRDHLDGCAGRVGFRLVRGAGCFWSAFADHRVV